jgi:hypothetical protein
MRVRVKLQKQDLIFSVQIYNATLNWEIAFCGA